MSYIRLNYHGIKLAVNEYVSWYNNAIPRWCISKKRTIKKNEISSKYNISKRTLERHINYFYNFDVILDRYISKLDVN